MPQSQPAPDPATLRASVDLVFAARAVVLLTGAGISTDSGLPDFRGPQGIWTLNPKAERISSLQHYLADPQVRALAWQGRVEMYDRAVAPNDGHRALVELEQAGRLHTLVTQNIDGLHQLAGSSPECVVEVHGTFRRARCWSCLRESPIETFLDRVRAGEADPSCPMCGGVVKAATILFGQSLVEADLERAFEAARAADLLVCVGSTLSVGPVNQMVPIAAHAGTPVVIVNGAPTEMDHLATHVLRGSISEILPELCGAEATTDLAHRKSRPTA